MKEDQKFYKDDWEEKRHGKHIQIITTEFLKAASFWIFKESNNTEIVKQVISDNQVWFSNKSQTQVLKGFFLEHKVFLNNQLLN